MKKFLSICLLTMPTLITPLLNAECLGGSDISPEKHELREIAWRGNLSPLQVLGFKKLDSKIIKKKPALQINPEWALRNEDGKAQIESDLEETIDTRLYSIYSEESFQNYQQTQSDMECALEKLDETFEIKANENLDQLISHQSECEKSPYKVKLKNGNSLDAKVCLVEFIWNKGYVKDSTKADETGVLSIKGHYFWSLRVTHQLQVRKVKGHYALVFENNSLKILNGAEIESLQKP